MYDQSDKYKYKSYFLLKITKLAGFSRYFIRKFCNLSKYKHKVILFT